MSYKNNAFEPLAATIEEAYALKTEDTPKGEYARSILAYNNHSDYSLLLIPTRWWEEGTIAIFSAATVGKNAVRYTDSSGKTGILVWREFESYHGQSVQECRNGVLDKCLRRTPAGRKKLKERQARAVDLAAKTIKKGVVRAEDIHILTGWCRQGIRSWAEKHGIQGDEISAKDLLKVIHGDNDYYACELRRLLGR